MRFEIAKHKIVYFLLGLILIFSAIFRLYRIDALLGFYYDQGRDALRVGDILQGKDFPAIGPTTGIAGIFLGPFWLYFLAPLYWLGRGNPVVPAAMVGLTDVGTTLMIYMLGKEFFDRRVGLLSAFFWGFSYYLVRSARWLSHPPLLPFFTVLLILFLMEYFLKKKEKYLLLVAACLGISLQLEAASAIFFFPTLVLIWLFLKVKLRDKRIALLAFLILGASFLPQILFEVKNNFLMTRNLLNFNRGNINTDTQTWSLPTIRFARERVTAYFQIFFSKIETNPGRGAAVFSLSFIFLFLIQLAKAVRNPSKKVPVLILSLFLAVPLVGLLFFSGNYGQLYDYYLTGSFPAFIILFALFTSLFLREKIFLPIFFLIIAVFLKGNLPFLRNYLIAGVDGPTHISLGNQLQAIDWIYKDAGNEKFNVDIYVPPVIPYAYQYLFPWYGEKIYHRRPLEEKTPLLYTLYEVDPPHPERLNAWQERQAGIGKIFKSQSFGGITVQRRERIQK